MRTDRGGWSDARLLSAIDVRDTAAFGVFYQRHLPATLHFLLARVDDRELAADLAAEVFATVLLVAGKYQPLGESALPWVLGIARNKLLMSFRRGRIEAQARRRLGMEPIEFDDAALDAVEALADAGSSHLLELLERLSEREREAVRMRVLMERDYGEIARDLCCSEMVARKRVSRGLDRLRQMVGEAEAV